MIMDARLDAKTVALLLSLKINFGSAPMRLSLDTEQASLANTDGTIKLSLSKSENEILHSAIDLGYILQRQNWLALSPKGKITALRAVNSAQGHYADQHRALAKTSQNQTINLKESPLLWLASRRGTDGRAYLSKVELNAGEKLRQDFEISGLQPRTTMSWRERSGKAGKYTQSGSGHELADFKLDAKRRFDDALLSLEPQQRGLLIDICCLLKGLEVAEKERGWPRRSAKIVLKCALAQLAHHYQIAPKEWGQSRHWGAEDFRPTL